MGSAIRWLTLALLVEGCAHPTTHTDTIHPGPRIETEYRVVNAALKGPRYSDYEERVREGLRKLSACADCNVEVEPVINHVDPLEVSHVVVHPDLHGSAHRYFFLATASAPASKVYEVVCDDFGDRFFCGPYDHKGEKMIDFLALGWVASPEGSLPAWVQGATHDNASGTARDELRDVYWPCVEQAQHTFIKDPKCPAKSSGADHHDNAEEKK